ncbi:MAG: undecaprenyl-diphosphate phosphatase [Actinobacteria bacterium]|nr:MAG: undecaprenyl-diphosphate phosphatase [Actinomycetota bacterium]
MTIIQAIILGIVQGLTEFLPISSSAHLVLLPKLFGWPQLLDSTTLQVNFDIALHFGSLIAVVGYFWNDLNKMALSVTGKRQNSSERRLLVFLLIATLPAAIFGIVFKDFFEQLFDKPLLVAFFLIGTGLIIVLAESAARPHKSLKEMTFSESLAVGFGQALAIIPGISRSGSTISIGIWSGLKRQEAARFSFLLSVPVILGATIVSLSDFKFEYLGVTLVGFISSLIMSYLAIKYLISYLKRGNLRIFALYCFLAGGFYVIFSTIR